MIQQDRGDLCWNLSAEVLCLPVLAEIEKIVIFFGNWACILLPVYAILTMYQNMLGWYTLER